MLKNRLFYNIPNDQGATPSPETPSNDINFEELFGSFSGVQDPQEPQETAGAGNPPVEQPQGQQPPVVDPNAPPTAPMAQPQQPAPPAATQAELAELRGHLLGFVQANQQQKPQATPQPAPTAAEIFPVQLSDEIIQMMSAEDPSMRRRAYEHLGSELGARVLQETQRHVSGVVNQIIQSVPQMVTSMIAQQNQMQRWHDDFYKAYPQLGASPQLKRFVGAVAAQLAQSGAIQGLDDAAFDVVAQNVVKSLGGNPQAIRRAGATPAVPTIPPRRPAVAGNTARQMPNGNPVDPNSALAIDELLSGGFR